MKKKAFRIYFLSMVAVLSVLTCCGQSTLYNYSITSVGGQTYPLNIFQGEKIILIVMTSTQTSTDTAFIARLDSIAIARKGNVKMIVVPSYDDGYIADSANTFLNWYGSSLDSSIILSQPLYTHKTSGAIQDSTFQFLTHATMNVHFDDDVAGGGSMYFINEQGSLYNVFDPSAMFSNKALAMVLP